MNKICVVGERVSGTCFVQSLVTSNTNLKSVSPYGHKHFYQDMDLIRKTDTSNTLFVFVSRDILDWLKSFKKTTFHADKPIRHCKDMSSFLRMEWKCIFDSTSGTPESSSQYGQEMMFERDPSDGKRFVNVVKMRNSKLRHFLSIEDHVENYVHARYEDVRDDPEKFIQGICDKYLICKNKAFLNVDTARGKGRVPYTRTIYPEMSAEDVDYVLLNVDADLESLLGYL